MKQKFLEGIKIVKRFWGDIELLSSASYGDIDFDFYKNNYEKLLLYISKSFLSDNFGELFENLDDEVARTVFNDMQGENSDCPLLQYITERHYCKIPKRLLDDPMLAYRVIIRNKLCHYEYDFDKDRIIFQNVDFDKDAVISIASIVNLLKATLSSRGQSTKKGAYEYYSLLSNRENQSLLIRVQNTEDNILSPSSVVIHFDHDLELSGFKNKISSPTKLLNAFKRAANIHGHYYIRNEDFELETMRKAHISRVSNKNELDLYMCAHDEIKRAGITYNMLLDIIFKFRDKDLDGLKEIDDRYYPVLLNTVFISFMSLVFDDLFAKNFSGVIDSGLFIEKSDIQDKDIPRKFRNSLAHSRYRFEDIFNASNGIIIEFWDEDDKGINFECKITKRNAEKLIDSYLAQCV